ncbi:glycoside hydrolase [Choanephora cucurbitarum]|nr:glycoside hydrolase [Choanephora cucurbitarum]
MLNRACQPKSQRAKLIRDAYLYAYDGYKEFAFGHDELLSVSKSYSDSRNGWGASIIDSLDTMLIMGLYDEYEEALGFVEGLDFNTAIGDSKGFETNIRYLGGLLAAYDLKPDPILLSKAIEVAELTLVPLFVNTKTPSGKSVKVPLTYMDVNNGNPVNTNTINLAEFGSYLMEFTRLSQVSGDPKYKQLVDDLADAIFEQPSAIPGLYPMDWTVSPFRANEKSYISIGGGADSYYEYLIKNYLLDNKKKPELLKMWQTSVESMDDYMLTPTAEDPEIQFVPAVIDNKLKYYSQELSCFWPGNIALGATQTQDPLKKNKYMKFASTFLRSCVEVWRDTKTGIAPEAWSFNPIDNRVQDKLTKLINSKHKQKRAKTFSIINSIYDLRPETIESIFYFYRLTGDKQYQDLAWSMFLNIDRYAKTRAGYSRMKNVDQVQTNLDDFQESFFFAETLKYLYLMFVDKDCISLNDFVFNTEAHPFKLPEAIKYQ